MKAITDARHTPLVKPWAIRLALPGGFDLDDFTVDEVAGTVICPNGITRGITKARKVVFEAVCSGCPLRSRCTTAARTRTLQLHEHDALQSEHRQRGEGPGLADQLPAIPADGRTQHRLARGREQP